jgi:L-asparaginase/beta-aspartyl-peptidase (threonine type)
MSLPSMVLSHGGVGGPREHSDGCERACDAGVNVLRAGGSALDAAIAATVVLEDDPRLNAGTGSNYRLDGRTIQMDAAAMDDTLRFGAVAAIERVKNPVLVAREVMDTPHMILAGEGATAFARALGFADHDPASERARRRYAEVRSYFAGTRERWPAWREADPEEWWNFPAADHATLKALAGPSDTVGAVAAAVRRR